MTNAPQSSTSYHSNLSDVHLEFRAKASFPTVRRIADNLALLGDIGKPFHNSYAQFIEEQAQTFDNVFVVMGNHEYYNSSKTVDVILDKARQICFKLKNVHLLERDTFDFEHNDVTVLGCTLWSPINAKTSAIMNDMYKIHIWKEGKRLPLDRFTYLDGIHVMYHGYKRS